MIKVPATGDNQRLEIPGGVVSYVMYQAEHP